MKKGRKRKVGARGAAGFSLVELLIAMAVLAVGIVAVMQMVAMGTRTNKRNRNDSTALITAQRLLEQMARQPVDVQNGICGAPGGHYYYCDEINDDIALGQQGAGVTVAGCPLDATNQQLNFGVACAAVGYTVTKAQIWNPTPGAQQGQNVELRWRVYTLHDGTGAPVRKVIIIGARNTDLEGFVITNLQTVVGR